MLHDTHEVVAWVYLALNGIAGVWALAAHQFPELRRRVGWYLVGVAQAVVVVQTLLGVALQVRDDVEGGQHQLYGFAAFASVGIIFAYRNEMRNRPHLLYGLGSLWMMGLGIRAMFLV